MEEHDNIVDNKPRIRLVDIKYLLKNESDTESELSILEKIRKYNNMFDLRNDITNNEQTKQELAENYSNRENANIIGDDEVSANNEIHQEVDIKQYVQIEQELTENYSNMKNANIIGDEKVSSTTEIKQEVPIKQDVQITQELIKEVSTSNETKQEVSLKEVVVKHVKEEIISLKRKSMDDVDTETVRIGPNKTPICALKYCSISWHCYKEATKALLMALFGRETLATHSLTGKAGSNHKILPRPQLDVKIIEDVIFTVAKKCNGVNINEIRYAISRKCADEHKIHKMRIEQKARNKVY